MAPHMAVFIVETWPMSHIGTYKYRGIFCAVYEYKGQKLLLRVRLESKKNIEGKQHFFADN